MPIREIQVTRGGTIHHDCAGTGKVTEATWKALDASGVQLASGTAELDPVDTDLSAIATEGATVLSVTTAAGIRPGGYYVLEGLGGLSEVLRARAGMDNEEDPEKSAVLLWEPIGMTYPEGALLYGSRISAALTGTAVATVREGCELRWTITQGGETYETSTYFDVVRSVWPAPLLASQEFRAMVGALGVRELSDFQAPADHADEIETATEAVRAEVRDRGQCPGRYRDPSVFKRAVVERVLLTWAERAENVPTGWQQDPHQWLTVRREAYSAALGIALNSPYDADQSGVVDGPEVVKRWSDIEIRL